MLIKTAWVPLKQGATIKELTERLGIQTAENQEACKHLVNLGWGDCHRTNLALIHDGPLECWDIERITYCR